VANLMDQIKKDNEATEMEQTIFFSMSMN
jgi:hypothetical protein